MSDSHFCQAHWRDSDLINADIEWEAEELEDDDIIVPLKLQPVSAEENEQALFEQQMEELEQQWNDQDLPIVVDPDDPALGDTA
ncbi:hypothetical protein BGZ51_001697 [Haplosporangium sp. Z 767]|nr:hypothetical protein BGZ51_001697 [Haplosporangium sp. Z 767]KAF9188455.1 hypothetical protein BGZ50_001354 [Haplosporangium sp. Z 11]